MEANVYFCENWKNFKTMYQSRWNLIAISKFFHKIIKSRRVNLFTLLSVDKYEFMYKRKEMYASIFERKKKQEIF